MLLRHLPTRLIVPLAAVTAFACGDEATTAAVEDSAPPDAPVFADVEDTAPDATTDVEADAPPAPGEFGAPCQGNADCLSGYCVEGPAGYICTRQCDTTCPDGFDCKSIPGSADVSFVCVPRLDKLCTPCTDDTACGGGACLVPGGDGGARGCAPPCDLDTDCAAGFACAPDPDGRAPGTYCQPLTRSCACSAVRDEGERACSRVTDSGTCRGIELCDPEVGWGLCSAATPGPEQCNGLDDDCDGRLDDGLAVGGPCDNAIVGVGSCPGALVCTGTPGWICQGPLPEVELCNGLDDDCDDAIDEDFRDADGRWTRDDACGRCGNDCTTRFANGVGRCGGSPEAPTCVVDRCDEGFVLLGSQCVPPIDTTCQPCVVDDDCFGGACLPFESQGQKVCLMPCAPEGCADGLSCQTLSGATGALDRCAPSSGSCACTPALAGNQRTCSVTNQHGRCFGVETCEQDAWSTCTAETPALEICNEVDDDCDGQKDEEARWENRGTPCVVGLGICRAAGVWQCDPADRAGPTVCSVTPAAGRTETCDGLDDDCDGATDEDLALPACPLQAGVCAGARAVCAGTVGFLDCNVGSYGPRYELDERSCDGLDNDCDGLTDEVDRDGDGHIAVACGGDDCDDDAAAAHPGRPEICGDALDNDCSGVGDDKDTDRDGARDLACGGDDCDDTRASVRPGLVEVCGDAIDEDCSGSADDRDLDDVIALSLAGVEIDRVAYGAGFPLEIGHALNLDPAQLTRTGNDVSGNWCATPAVGANLLSGGGYGSPGRLNPSCSGAPAIVAVVPADGIMHGGDVVTLTGSGFIAASAVSVGGPCQRFTVVDDQTIRCTTAAHAAGLVAVTVDKGAAQGTLANGYRFTGEDVTVITWVDLQYPRTLTVTAGAVSELVFGQVRAHGVTEADGPPPGLLGQVGWGPLGTDPRTSPGWRWLDATWNKQFWDNDEYMRSLVIPTPGTYSYAYRFSDDGGTHFMYGDYDPGTADGLTVDNLGTVTVLAP